MDEFKKTYFDIKSRLAPFRLKDDFETRKTVANIDTLADRADVVHDGASTEGRFGFSIGHTVENYMSRAERYLSALERGEYPLKGMFCEPGGAAVDHSFIEKDGVMHLFYNRDWIGYEWDTRPADTIGHATTTDLKNWTIHTPCLSADKNLPESYQVWSPGVVEKDGIYYMYYTAVNINVTQSICAATSTDLFSWTKYRGNPVVKPGPWGEWSEDKWSDCRDSMVFVDDDGTAYMYYCTARHKDDGGMESAVGIASSADMFSWKDEGAYHFEICDISLESPYLIKHNNMYYLFYTNCGHGTAYAVSDNPVSGWKSLGMLMSRENPEASPFVPSCAEVFRYKGQWYISCAERQIGCEQYIEIFELTWNDDGTVSVGKRVE